MNLNWYQIKEHKESLKVGKGVNARDVKKGAMRVGRSLTLSEWSYAKG